ncbi:MULTISPECIES: hypothetical protein [Chryseobacterium]|uniref:hypothetical protein n=1 Tax=Chryseobacterium TaxID=59732 RepID=UPI0012DECEBD|nr:MULTISPECIES: hypothetical protein [Chryseobacterium]MBF6642855.1 hypothetical protein [Chryseobacterium indologenes]MEB4762410.1 hypothetical protein [Chryseobacterium indologenes]QIX81514.1 hypothetical protein FOB56_09840 [Chryseobacterium indologenes]QQQ69097.1 hypothetical protein JHW31_11175 [Chryseobacterium indologenes]UDQ55269.1 hypothetical protein LJF28_06285 [Chryseobacterium indologenes]
MKKTNLKNAKKIERQELKHLTGGIIIRDNICCFSDESNFCCEWAPDPWSCRGIRC